MRSTKVNAMWLAHLVGHVAHVLLVRPGQDHLAQPGAIRGQHLLLHPADLQHLAAQRHLAGHREVAAHRALAEHAGDGERDRDAGAGAVLGDRSRRQVDVQVVLLERGVRNRELAGPRSHVRMRRVHGFTHHVAQLPGHGQPPGAGHAQRLDHHQFAARGRPRESRDHAHLRLLLRGLRHVLRHAEQFLHPLLVDHPRALFPLRLPARALAQDRREVAFEVAQPRLARVAIRDEGQRLVGELDVPVVHAVIDEQLGQQVAPRDLDLLLHRVAGDLDDLHAVAQRAGNVEQIVRRADEQHRREIERQVQVVVDERPVLRGVEHLEHRRRRIARRPAARHLVDLVDHQHRIVHLHAPQRLDQQPGHRAHVRAPVAAHLRLVAHAAHRDPVARPPDRGADRLAQRRLARARRPDEAEDRPLRRPPAQLAHGEELENALLGLVQSVVSRVE